VSLLMAEDGGSIFLRNVIYVQDHEALLPRISICTVHIHSRENPILIYFVDFKVASFMYVPNSSFVKWATRNYKLSYMTSFLNESLMACRAPKTL
jgi:hypothetical protein